MPNRHTITDSIDDDVTVVCQRTPPLLMPDNVVGVCWQCWHMIQYRLEVPAHLRKFCVECAMPMIEALAARGEMDMRATQKTIDEVRRHLQRAHGKTD